MGGTVVRQPFEKTCRRAQVEWLRAGGDFGIPEAEETMVPRMLFVLAIESGWD